MPTIFRSCRRRAKLSRNIWGQSDSWHETQSASVTICLCVTTQVSQFNCRFGASRICLGFNAGRARGVPWPTHLATRSGKTRAPTKNLPGNVIDRVASCLRVGARVSLRPLLWVDPPVLRIRVVLLPHNLRVVSMSMTVTLTQLLLIMMPILLVRCCCYC